MDKTFEELQARELEEHERETEFSLSVEEARKALEDDRKKFEEEKVEFERNHPEAEEELDSGIGSRNESAELYEADEEDVEDAIEDSEEYEEEELVPPRRNKYDFYSVNSAIYSTDLSSRWYPEVGKAPPPNITSVRGRVRHVNKNYNPKSAKR